MSRTSVLLDGHRCMASSHIADVWRLIEDDRVLLKDLRVLTVLRIERGVGNITVHYYELATKERGTLEVPANQKVKLLCPYATGAGRCYLNRELDELL